MTDKEKIKEEIESYKESMKSLWPHSDFRRGQITAYNHILQFIDSLPEEHKCIYNRTLEERKKFCKYCSAACGVRIEEEPVSEDLDKEVHKHLLNIGATIEMYSGNVMGLDLCEDDYVDFARHFAEWQRKKDQETIELAEDHAMLAGMEKMREEMMKDAVDGEICGEWRNQEEEPYELYAESYEIDNSKFKMGDKVKIIIVKEE